MSRARTPVEDRFWTKVNKTDSCWLWTGHKRSTGYGQFRGFRQEQASAHRVSWEIHRGDIPDGMSVLHVCDTPLCVNPDHLFLGTCADNMRDKVNKGRHRPGRWMGKIDEDDVRNIRAAHSIGWRNSHLATIFEVTRQHIRQIVSGKNWANVR